MQGSVIGGVGRSLLEHLRPLGDRVDLTLLTDARQPPIGHDRSLGLAQIPLRAPLSRGAAWLQLAAPRFLRGFPGIFHCPFYGLPFWQPTPMVVTIHDLTFETRPEWFTREQRAVFQVQARWAARTARRILTPSELTRAEVCDRYHVEPERVIVARNLLDPVYAEPTPPRPVSFEGLGVGDRYVVAVAGAPRRGSDLLLAMWPAVRRSQPDVTLVVIGHGGSLPLPEGAVNGGRLSDTDWRGALADAEAFCYPTQHEGFGYPALEACALGTPVVCSPVGALPEVLGSAAHWVTPLAPDALARALLEVLTDKALQDQLVRAGRARVGAIDRAEPPAAIERAYREAAAG